MSNAEGDVREQVAQEIERFVRTPPGVEPSAVTKAYIHAAHIARTSHVHDAWSECPGTEEGSK